jgi:hypothetical protein
MANTLSTYDPLFYAQEGLKILKNALGLAPRVFRGYDRTPREKGSITSIRIPGTFTADDAPSTEQAIVASEVQVSLDYWREVKFAATDKDLTISKEELITEHIEPAVYELADDIDTTLALLMYRGTPWEVAASAPADVGDVVACRTRLFNNKAPMKDDNRHFMVDGTVGGELLADAAFAQFQGAGQVGADTQIRGTLGTRYGMTFFENQNVQTHTAGAVTAATPVIKTTVAAGLKAVIVDCATLTGDVNIGDTFTIAGHSQAYVITADATAASNEIALAFEPGLEAEATAEDAVVFSQNTGSQSLAFHRNYCALAMAPLSTMGNELGAQIETVYDPDTNIGLRARKYYVGETSKVYVAFDCLYGIKILRPNLCVRFWNA